MRRFIQHLASYIPFTAAEEGYLTQTLSILSTHKGDILLREGQTSQHFYFNLSGCCRMYYMVDGVEKNTFFHTEKQFISSYQSFVHQTPSTHYIDCIEDSELVVISKEDAFKLLTYSPKFEQLSRLLMEEELMIYQKMLSSFITQDAEQRYAAFIRDEPDLAQRIPQYHLASYLGVSPETLSRIRKRLAQKKH